MQNHEIYAKVFDCPQIIDSNLVEFLREKHALLAQINPRHNVTAEVDMLYSMLSEEVREKIPRNNIMSFEHFIELVKDLELELKDRKDRKSRTRSEFNHLNISGPSKVNQEVLRSRSVAELQQSTRPGIIIRVAGLEERAIFNVSANVNIASFRLFQHLKKQKCVFKEVVANVDNYMTREEKEVFVTTVPIVLKKITFSVQFIIFKDLKNKWTVLGYGFIENAGIWLELSKDRQWKWGFKTTAKENGYDGYTVKQTTKDDDFYDLLGFLSISLS